MVGVSSTRAPAACEQADEPLGLSSGPGHHDGPALQRAQLWQRWPSAAPPATGRSAATLGCAPREQVVGQLAPRAARRVAAQPVARGPQDVARRPRWRRARSTGAPCRAGDRGVGGQGTVARGAQASQEGALGLAHSRASGASSSAASAARVAPVVGARLHRDDPLSDGRDELLGIEHHGVRRGHAQPIAVRPRPG